MKFIVLRKEVISFHNIILYVFYYSILFNHNIDDCVIVVFARNSCYNSNNNNNDNDNNNIIGYNSRNNKVYDWFQSIVSQSVND